MPNSAFTPSVLTISSGSSGSGAGEISAITNGSAATDTTGWTSATRSLSSSPLSPVTTTCFSISTTAGAESSTSGGYATFTMPTGLQNRKLKVEFYFTTPATDVYRVSVYKGGTRVPLTTDSSSVTTLPASVTGGKFTAYFDTDTTSSWTLNITRTSGTTGACLITNVIVGPGIQPQGAVVGEWQGFTPTTSWVSNVTWTGQKRRVGSVAEYFVKGTLTGAPTATQLTITIPDGTLNTNVITAAGNDLVVGIGSYIDTGVNEFSAGIRVAMDSATAVRVHDSASGNFFNSTVPITWANGDIISLSYSIPIAEWAGSGTANLAQNDVEYAFNTSGITAAGASDTTSFGYGPQGVAWGSIDSTTGSDSNTVFRVRFQRPIQSTDVIVVETDEGTSGAQWVATQSTQTVNPYQNQGGSRYGIAITLVNSTDVNVAFGNRGRTTTSGTYTANGSTWGGVGTWRWRVRKSSAGAAVGFGIVNPGVSSGLVSASGLPGSTTGTPISTGFVGQKVSGTMSDVTFSAPDTAINAGSISLNKGIYMVYARTRTVPGGSTHTQNNMGISTASASLQHPYYVSDQSTNITFSRYQQFARYVEITSDATTIYVVVVATYTGTAASVASAQGDVYAVRIA